MHYTGIIFDLDGTLVDSFPAIHQSLTVAMKGVGVTPWSLETTKQHVGHGVEHLVESAVGRTKKAEALRYFKDDYSKASLERTHLFPGVLEGLKTLQDSGFVLAVATNKPLSFTQPILNHLQINACFACVMGPEKVLHPKPHPDMIHAILEEFRWEASSCLYVGDMPLDAQTASQAGVDCLLVATGAFSLSDLKRETSVPVLQSFSDIPAFLGVERGSG